MKEKFNDDDDECAHTNGFLHSPTSIVETNAYLNQLISSEDKR